MIKDIYSRDIGLSNIYANNDTILQSSDLYELIQDLSNQVAMAIPVVIDKKGNKITDHKVLDIINKPNNYLTGFEFSKLEMNTFLAEGEVFTITDGEELHIAYNVQTKLLADLTVKYEINGQRIPSESIRHIKNVGTQGRKGVGIVDLAKNTLESVLNAENVLTTKYVKGGLIAFLLKLDAHINPTNGTQSKLVNAILDQLEGTRDDNKIKMIPLGKGYSIDTLNSPIQDDNILKYLGVYKKDVGKFLGINVETYQYLLKHDLEKAMMYLHNKVIKPYLKNKSDHYTALFFTPESGYSVEWEINILDFVPYSTKTNIGYNIVRTGITSPDNVAEMLGFPQQNTEESTSIYISKDLMKIGEKNATDDSLPSNQKDKGGDDNQESGE
ncbi:phage portal protein [Vagococcus carniphilus]|nr:phage portal protein [Vagococcus carniphilus]MDT2850171.1 phage portal protein [Vagococcus carniphilus]